MTTMHIAKFLNKSLVTRQVNPEYRKFFLSALFTPGRYCSQLESGSSCPTVVLGSILASLGLVRYYLFL